MNHDYNQCLEEQIKKVDRFIANSEIEQAISLLFEMIQDNPEYGKSYNYLGWIFETKQRRYNEAEELYQKCIELMPDYPAAYLNYLYLLNTFQRGDEAAEIIEKLCKIKLVNRYRLLKEWAFMLEYSGKLKEAEAKQKEAIIAATTNQDLDEAQKDLERIYRKINFLNPIK